jgi:hypothetical protein
LLSFNINKLKDKFRKTAKQFTTIPNPERIGVIDILKNPHLLHNHVML